MEKLILFEDLKLSSISTNVLLIIHEHKRLSIIHKHKHFIDHS